MLEAVKGYSLIEYLISFESIILGLIASSYFEGWGDMLRRRKRIKVSYTFIAFTVLTFFILLIHWWNIWYRADLLKTNIFYFLSAVPYFIFYYLIIFYQFKLQSDHEDLVAYFEKHKKPLFTGLGLYFTYDLFIPGSNDDIVFTEVGIILCIIVIIFNRKWLVSSVIAAGLLLCVIYLVFESLGYRDLQNFSNVASQYSRAEHVTILISIVFGYVITQYFSAWSNLFYHRRLSYDLLFFTIWTVVCFLFLIQKWWWIWGSPLFTDPSLIHFVMLLSISLLLYFITEILIPEEKFETELPIFQYWLETKQTFMILLIMYFAMNMLSDLLLGSLRGTFFLNFLRLVGIGFCFSAIFIHKRYYQHFLSVLALIMVILAFVDLV